MRPNRKADERRKIFSLHASSNRFYECFSYLEHAKNKEIHSKTLQDYGGRQGSSQEPRQTPSAQRKVGQAREGDGARQARDARSGANVKKAMPFA